MPTPPNTMTIRTPTLLQLDISKSKAPDGIPAIVLKTYAPELAPILNILFQHSYTLGTFPISWKQAHIFPIPKKCNKSNPLNYHPIAITSLISKTMETIATKQLLTFLETNNLLADHQFGFRKARSTGDLLAHAVRIWSSALESLSISPRPSFLFGTRVFPLNYRCLVSIRLLLIGLVVSFLIGQLTSEWTASSPICTPSMLVYPRALSSPLYSSFSS